jgi:hypothetical protein
MAHLKQSDVLPILRLLKEATEKCEDKEQQKKFGKLYETLLDMSKSMLDKSVIMVTETKDHIVFKRPPWLCPMCQKKAILNFKYDPIEESFIVFCPECGEGFSS